MKSIISIAVLGFLLVAEAAKDHCSKPQDVMNSASVLESTPWKSMHSSCTEDVKRQIGMEYDAAIKYLSLGAYFAMDVVNRPGFAKFFFESASEERQHAIKLIEYLSMRGEEVTDVSKLVSINTTRMPGAFESTMTGKKALELALAEEVKVTESIVKLVKICEKEEKQFSAPSEANKMFNDYHLVDWLTGEFLDEQYRGQRDLAGKISTLMKMGTSNYLLGEFLFDKKLLSNQV